jgi:hypothetical protein
MRKAAITVAVAALAAFGCSKSDKSSTGPGGSSSCSVTLSGSQTGTYDCTPAEALHSTAGDTAGFGFQVNSSTTQPDIVSLILWSGTPAAGEWKSTDMGAAGAVAVSTTAGAAWYTAAGNIGLPAQGSYDLKVSSVSNPVQTDSGTAYTVHGSLTASLPAASGTGASGTVTVNATF